MFLLSCMWSRTPYLVELWTQMLCYLCKWISNAKLCGICYDQTYIYLHKKSMHILKSSQKSFSENFPLHFPLKGTLKFPVSEWQLFNSRTCTEVDLLAKLMFHHNTSTQSTSYQHNYIIINIILVQWSALCTS